MGTALTALVAAWLGWWQPGPLVVAALRVASVWDLPIGQPAVVGQGTVQVRGPSGEQACAVQLAVPEAEVGQAGLCDAQLSADSRPIGPRHHRVRVLGAGRVWVHLEGACPPVPLALQAGARPRPVADLGACPGRLRR